MHRFRNTLRRAYLDWQALEAKGDAARQELKGHYAALGQMTGDLGNGPSQGILAAARVLLEEPLEKAALKAHTRLKLAFQVLGRSFWRQAPASLQLDLLNYGSRVEETCQRCDRLSARLQLARKIIEKTGNHQEPAADALFRLALASPEAAAVLFQLRQRRLATRQVLLDSLTRSLQTRAAVCRGWLEVLRDSLSARTVKQGKKSLNDLLDKAMARRGKEAVPDLILSHRKLDALTGMLNKRVGQRMAEE